MIDIQTKALELVRQNNAGRKSVVVLRQGFLEFERDRASGVTVRHGDGRSPRLEKTGAKSGSVGYE